MKISAFMIYKEVLEKRLDRKKEQLAEIEKYINSEGVAGSVDKRKYIELKAVVNELENCLIWPNQWQRSSNRHPI